MIDRALSLTPIGVVRSPFRELADAPRQTAAGRGVEARIELASGRHLEDAIDDLAQWTHLWIIFWFDRAGGYRPKVQPPRSDRRRGVLATRSPHRPNPIGLSVVRLVRVEGLVLHVRDVDMVDGTPVLDVKPYVAYADAIDDAGGGWLAEDPEPAWQVCFSPLATTQLAFLIDHGVDLRSAVEARLALGPRPHAYRRIRLRGDHAELALEDWRVDFRATGRTVEVLRIRSGYRPKQLAAGGLELAPHCALVARFG